MRITILAFLLLASCGGAGYDPQPIQGAGVHAYSTGGSSYLTEIHYTPGPVNALAVDVGPLHRDNPAGPLSHYLGDLPNGPYTATITYSDHVVSMDFWIHGEAFYVVAE